ncbi:dentin sialophosphoprotein-like [Hyperolius riggenbachi]|uniref:dentin sialophosphoprotein-like n=1 Tax=Hyperolius riggenbachi TaxID=752182 RepID=UPI0035A2D74E
MDGTMKTPYVETYGRKNTKGNHQDEVIQENIQLQYKEGMGLNHTRELSMNTNVTDVQGKTNGMKFIKTRMDKRKMAHETNEKVEGDMTQPSKHQKVRNSKKKQRSSKFVYSKPGPPHSNTSTALANNDIFNDKHSGHKKVNKRSVDYEDTDDNNNLELNEPLYSYDFPDPDRSSENWVDLNSDDVSENHDPAISSETNETDSSELNNSAGTPSTQTESEESDNTSSSNESASNDGSQESTPAGSDEMNSSPVLNGRSSQSDSSEPDVQSNMLAIQDNTSERLNDSCDSNMKTDCGLSSESQSTSTSSSESSDQSDSNESNDISDSNSSSNSFELINGMETSHQNVEITVNTTDEMIENVANR